MGRGLAMKEHRLFFGANVESSFHEQSLTTTSRPAGWVLKRLKVRILNPIAFIRWFPYQNYKAQIELRH
jgi:hypothetical protein